MPIAALQGVTEPRSEHHADKGWVPRSQRACGPVTRRFGPSPCRQSTAHSAPRLPDPTRFAVTATGRPVPSRPGAGEISRLPPRAARSPQGPPAAPQRRTRHGPPGPLKVRPPAKIAASRPQTPRAARLGPEPRRGLPGRPRASPGPRKRPARRTPASPRGGVGGRFTCSRRGGIAAHIRGCCLHAFNSSAVIGGICSRNNRNRRPRHIAYVDNSSSRINPIPAGHGTCRTGQGYDHGTHPQSGIHR